MEEEELNKVAELVIETLSSGGWCIGDIDQVKALIFVHSALSDDGDARAVAESVESELLNMDIKTFGAISLPDPNLLRKSSHIHGPKVLQISSARDISVSSMEGSSDSGNRRRLMRLVLTDGHNEITAIEYSHVPAIPSDIIPGTKVRLENKAPVHSGIVCLNPKVISVMGGVVQSLYEEWQMNQKYSGFSRSSLRISQEAESGGPPQFEKLQIGAPFGRSSRQGRHSDMASPSSSSVPVAAENGRKLEFRPSGKQKNVDNAEDKVKTDPFTENIEPKPNNSEARLKEVVESVPVQNQAAAQKLLQKMSHPNQDHQHSRGWKNRGKVKQEERQVFTLDEWERGKAGANHQMRKELADTSCGDDLEWQLQCQLDMEDSHLQMGMHNTVADDIRMSMFSYGRNADRYSGTEHGGRGRGRGRGRVRGRGRGSGRGGWWRGGRY